jgi:sterol desaturase/sphingolipid hydroxylase (fatty acid hydroxylase superfamily)
MWIQLFLHIFGYDLWFYISHRLLHTRALWWIHAQHHERRTGLRWLDAYHGHWLESTVQPLGFLLPLVTGQAWNWTTALITAALINARGLARHDERCSWIPGIIHHLKHHSNPKVNFGEPWLDVLCGTMQLPLGERQDLRIGSA